MLHIESLYDGLALFKALGSEIRLEIITLLLDSKGMNMNELAGRLHITNGALTSHIRKLEACGIVSISNESTGHGNQKICSVVLDKVLVDINAPARADNAYHVDIGVGQYSDYRAAPTCGLAMQDCLIGEVDDVRYFAHPDHFKASILWFTRGFVEYEIPNFIPHGQTVSQLTVSAELSSEAPGANNNWPSDICFYLNDVFLGSWTSPGDFGDTPGVFTPDWWYPNWNQYGLLKLLIINENGTFIDGIRLSDVSTRTLRLDSASRLRFRMEVDERSAHIGGLTIYGKGFGNYAQDIRVSVSCEADTPASASES